MSATTPFRLPDWFITDSDEVAHALRARSVRDRDAYGLWSDVRSLSIQLAVLATEPADYSAYAGDVYTLYCSLSEQLPSPGPDPYVLPPTLLGDAPGSANLAELDSRLSFVAGRLFRLVTAPPGTDTDSLLRQVSEEVASVGPLLARWRGDPLRLARPGTSTPPPARLRVVSLLDHRTRRTTPDRPPPPGDEAPEDRY